MLLVGKAVFMVISFNAVEGVQSYATCRKGCFFMVISFNAVEGVHSHATCRKGCFLRLFL